MSLENVTMQGDMQTSMAVGSVGAAASSNGANVPTTYGPAQTGSVIEAPKKQMLRGELQDAM